MLSPSFSLCRLLNGIEPPCLVHLFTARWRLNNLRFIAWNYNYFSTLNAARSVFYCEHIKWRQLKQVTLKTFDRAGPSSITCFNWEIWLHITCKGFFSIFTEKTRFLFYLDTAWSVYSRETISWGHETPKISDSLKRFVWKRKRISFISHILQLLY